MSGHSHWATTHRQKGVNDAKRGAVFTKYGRNIIVAASHGGGNPDTNFSLRLAIDQAKTVNMPKENIERAIKRGTGELKDGVQIEELTYDAYGPGNIALLIETTTDNKNRTVSEIKSILTKGGGKFVPAGSVGFLFKRVGMLSFPAKPEERENYELTAIDSGADDFSSEEGYFIVYTKPEDFQRVKDYFETRGPAPETATLGYVPLQTAALPENATASFEKLFETLEDHADVQTVWTNLE
ncbi:MAG: YebC/PmpR family DNA-binding transcriptional regulator [Candidatus Moraniibacteriota bacterium]